MMMAKYEEKVKHLRKKYRTDEEEKLNKIPDSMKDLNLENKGKFEEKVVIEYEVDVIGDVELSDKERMILRLPSSQLRKICQ